MFGFILYKFFSKKLLLYISSAESVDINNNDSCLYITGYSFGTIDSQVHAGSADILVMKFNLSGIWVWTKLIGGSSDET